MKTFTDPRLLITLLALSTPIWTAFACAPQAADDDGNPIPPPMTGGATGVGGAATTGGAAGAGGATGVGGAATTGGATGVGGATMTGGATGVGGAATTGGATGVGGTTGGAAGTGAAVGGAAGTAAAMGGTAGGAGAAMDPVKDCFNKVTVATPLLTDFETYDGVMPAFDTGSWTFQIGTAYAGLYPLSENSPPTSTTRSPTYSLAIAMGGASASMWAVHAANTATADWGGGVGMWMGCINASSYAGLTFWVKGTAPTGMLIVSLATEDTTPPDSTDPRKGGTCEPAAAGMACSGPSTAVALAAEWTQITLPWGMFSAGVGASGVAVPATGDKITGISFGAQMTYVPNPADDGGTFVPEAGAFDVWIDSIGFM
jgi:hypothetical protein